MLKVGCLGFKARSKLMRGSKFGAGQRARDRSRGVPRRGSKGVYFNAGLGVRNMQVKTLFWAFK